MSEKRIYTCSRCGEPGHIARDCTEPEPLGVSRQRLWQIRRVLEGRCAICGKPLVTATYCDMHRRRANACNSARYRARFPKRSTRYGLKHCRRCGRVGHNVRTCAETAA